MKAAVVVGPYIFVCKAIRRKSSHGHMGCGVQYTKPFSNGSLLCFYLCIIWRSLACYCVAVVYVLERNATANLNFLKEDSLVMSCVHIYISRL